MRRTTCVLAGVGLALVLIAESAAAADPVRAASPSRTSVEAAPWAQLQGRVSFGSATSAASRIGTQEMDGRTPGMSLMGDYYFTSSLLGAGTLGGFRATSGLIVGPRSQAWAGQPGLGAGGAFSVGTRLFGSAALPASLRDPASETAAMTYFGVGYTGLSGRGGWSFSADLGVAAPGPGAVQLGRAFGGQNLDDAVRDVRMRAMFQLGVSYAF